MITTKFHAAVDYLFGIAAIAAPWVLGFGSLKTPTYVLVTSGVITILVSLSTDYPGGLVKIVSMRSHLKIDVLIGVALGFSPWLLSFSRELYVPHLIMGVFAVVASLLTTMRTRSY